jgi:hypothetical protein
MAIEPKILTFGTNKVGTIGGKLMGYATPPPFVPTDVSGCYCWLDADDTTKTISGGRISEWRDKSGNLQHFSQPTGSLRPYENLAYQNGFNSVRFDNNQDNWMQRTFTLTKPQPLTIFTVWDVDVNSTRDFNLVYMQNAPSVGLYHSNPTGKLIIFAGIQANTYVKSKPFALMATTVIFNGANSQIFENDVNKGTYSSGANSLTQMILGNQAPAGAITRFSGNLMEHIIYDRQLNPTEITQVNTYLIGKYGL